MDKADQWDTPSVEFKKLGGRLSSSVESGFFGDIAKINSKKYFL